MRTPCRTAIWLARIATGLVFFLNVTCAFQFIVWPDRHAPSFELQGVPGSTMVRGIGVLFLMWNATFPLVLWGPDKHLPLFGIVLAQQVIAVAGEAWMWAALPAGHGALWCSGLRFLAFDSAGLMLMSVSFGVLVACLRRGRWRARYRTAPARGGSEPAASESTG